MSPTTWLSARPVIIYQLALAMVAALFLPRMLGHLEANQQALALGLAAAACLFDLTVTSAGWTWWRQRKEEFTPRSLINVVLAGLVLGAVALPSVPVKTFALASMDPLLLGIAIWAVIKLRQGFKQIGTVLDPIHVVSSRLSEALPRPVANFVTHELLIWWSLGRGAALVPTGSIPVMSHLRAGRNTYVWIYIFMELPLHFAIHMVMARDGHAAWAWLLTLADGAVAVYLLAFSRAYERFTSFILGDTFYLRQGLLWQADIPLDQIERVTTGFDPKALKLNLLVSPNVTLHLKEPVTLRGIWNIRRSSQLTVFIDDPKSLMDAVQPQN